MAEDRQLENDEKHEGDEKEIVDYETELAQFLQERIKPGLSSGTIPLVARSIAKEIARHDLPEQPAGSSNGDARNGPVPDFEADMRELQSELGDDWILRFSVHGEDGWLTAEKKDSSQRVEAETAEQLVAIVEAIDGTGESTADPDE